MSIHLVSLLKICKQIRNRKLLLTEESRHKRIEGKGQNASLRQVSGPLVVPSAARGSVTVRLLSALGSDGLAILQGHFFIVTPVNHIIIRVVEHGKCRIVFQLGLVQSIL